MNRRNGAETFFDNEAMVLHEGGKRQAGQYSNLFLNQNSAITKSGSYKRAPCFN